MDLTSDHPFWFIKNGLIRAYPPLENDESCDVVVIGAGITGSMIAERMTRAGLDVVVVDRRDVCLGSTSASTALLQYEIDVPLVEMSQKIGRKAAQRAYRLSYESIDKIENLVQDNSADCGFSRKTSFYLARDEKQTKLLSEETEARRAIGIDAEYLTESELEAEFQISGKAAIVSEQAAACDPYRLAHNLLRSAEVAGARIYDRTQITEFDHQAGKVCLKTDRGPTLTAKNVVVATGYEAQSMLKQKVVDLKSTYALISQPLDSLDPWDRDWIMWEAADPYLYLRATDDNRLLAGGEDDPFRNPERRDASLPKKTKRIREKVQQLLPELEWEVEFSWAGTFGETHDGLAYIGPTDEFPNCYFALGFGGNGITFSAIAADLLHDLLTGMENPDAELFRFGR